MEEEGEPESIEVDVAEDVDIQDEMDADTAAGGPIRQTVYPMLPIKCCCVHRDRHALRRSATSAPLSNLMATIPCSALHRLALDDTTENIHGSAFHCPQRSVLTSPVVRS